MAPETVPPVSVAPRQTIFGRELNRTFGDYGHGLVDTEAILDTYVADTRSAQCRQVCAASKSFADIAC